MLFACWLQSIFSFTRFACFFACSTSCPCICCATIACETLANTTGAHKLSWDLFRRKLSRVCGGRRAARSCGDRAAAVCFECGKIDFFPPPPFFTSNEHSLLAGIRHSCRVYPLPSTVVGTEYGRYTSINPASADDPPRACSTSKEPRRPAVTHYNYLSHPTIGLQQKVPELLT